MYSIFLPPKITSQDISHHFLDGIFPDDFSVVWKNRGDFLLNFQIFGGQQLLAFELSGDLLVDGFHGGWISADRSASETEAKCRFATRFA